MFRKLIVPIHSQTGEDLRCYSSSSPLSPLVILSLLPRWLPRPRRHLAGKNLTAGEEKSNKKNSDEQKKIIREVRRRV